MYLPRLRFGGGFALVSLSGCLWFLACTPFDLSGLAWIAAVPMLFAIDRAPTFRQALLLGWWAGVVETGGGFYWLIDTTQRFAGFSWPAAALVLLTFCAARALIFLLFTGIVRGIRHRRRLPLTLLAPLGMAACEYLVPQIFPCGQWITQAWHPLVIQIAELTGPWGVTALLMLVNGALVDLATLRRHAWIPVLSASAITAAVLIFGVIRMRQVDATVAQAARLRVGLVQPNFAYAADGSFSNAEALHELNALQEQSRRLQRAGAQLLIWTEGSYPVPLPRSFAADFSDDSLAMIRRGFDTPLIFGSNTYESAEGDAFNTALLLNRDGTVGGRYDKVWLLAFGEYIPGLQYFPWLQNFLPEGTGHFKAGAGAALLTLHDDQGLIWGLGPVICYEDLLPDFLRDVGRLHPNLLVNLTSDSWFGARTEPWEHLALSVFASVELRVSLVRAVNSGVSSFIDPNGRLLQKTYADDPYLNPRGADGIVVAAPRMSGSDTPFVRYGAWFAYSCMAALAILWSTTFRVAPAALRPAEEDGR